MNEIVKNESKFIQRTPELIAAEINNIKEQTRHMVLYNSIEIGRRLVEAKELVIHGEWGVWLEKSVEYSQSTANNLMRIFNEYGSDQITLLDNNAKSQALGNLSYTQAIALLGIPSEEREKFVKENDIDNISTRELQKKIKEKEETLKKLEEDKKHTDEKAEKLKKELDLIKKKNKEDLTNKEVEIQNFNFYINDIKKQLLKAQSSGNDEEVTRLQDSLQEAQKDLDSSALRIDELEAQLKAKPIEVVASPEIIEKVPEEVEKELNELREKLKNNDESVVKFKMKFEGLIKYFNELLDTLYAVDNAETREKYGKAVKSLIVNMLDKLE